MKIVAPFLVFISDCVCKNADPVRSMRLLTVLLLMCPVVVDSACVDCREHWGPLTAEDFLDTDFVVQRHHDIIESIFHRDPEVQEQAVEALRQLIAPMRSPHKFQIYEEAESRGASHDAAQHSSWQPRRPVQLLDRLHADAVMAMAEAVFALGMLLSTGVLPAVQKDDKQATALYALAASHNSVSGSMAIAHRYEQGFGVPKSCSLAYQHLKVRLSPLQRRPWPRCLSTGAHRIRHTQGTPHAAQSPSARVPQAALVPAALPAVGHVTHALTLSAGTWSPHTPSLLLNVSLWCEAACCSIKCRPPPPAVSTD